MLLFFLTSNYGVKSMHVTDCKFIFIIYLVLSIFSMIKYFAVDVYLYFVYLHDF